MEQVRRGGRASRADNREKIPGLVPIGVEKIFALLLPSLEWKGLNKTAGFSIRGTSLAHDRSGESRTATNRW